MPIDHQSFLTQDKIFDYHHDDRDEAIRIRNGRMSLINVKKLSSRSQRPQQIASALLCLYVIVGFLYGLSRDWGAVSSIYFVFVTLATVGYGDLTFDVQGHRIFGALFVLFGVIFVGAAIGIVIDGISQRREEQAKGISNPCQSLVR